MYCRVIAKGHSVLGVITERYRCAGIVNEGYRCAGVINGGYRSAVGSSLRARGELCEHH